MKRCLEKPAVLAVIFLVVYLLGLILGLLAILVYPVYHRQKDALLSRAQAVAAEYAQGIWDTSEYIKSPVLHILIYDAGGNCRKHITAQRFETGGEDGAGIQAYPEPYLSSALSGEQVFAIAPSYETPRKLTQLKLIAGVPVPKSEAAAGAVFLVRNLENLQEAYLGYMICFSVLYWVFVCLVISYLRKKKKLEEVQRNYIANVTHALKAPIASVKAITETLSDVADLEADKRIFYYGIILRETNLQSRMVQEILELSKLQSHGMDLTKKKVSAAEVFGPALEKCSTLCECAHITFCVSEEISHLPPLYTNAPGMGQVLEILLENAAKYVDSGDTIWCDAVRAKDHITFCVRDSGPGISQEDLPHVFERFYRCSRNTKTSSGLGLAIAKEIVDGLKEKIWVESALGKGTAFYFTVRTKG